MKMNALTLCVLLTASVSFAHNTAPDAAVLVPNGGFEEVDAATLNRPEGVLPAAWTARGVTLAAHRLVEDARTGRYAAGISFTQGEGNAVSGYYYSRPEPLPACKRVGVSAYVRVTAEVGAGQAHLRLLFQKGEQYVGISDSPRLGDTNGQWQRIEVSANPPPEAETWRMSVEFSGLGTVLFDDCELAIEAPDILPAATRDAPAGQAMALGDGLYGVLGPIVPVADGLEVVTEFTGRSALPQRLHIGTVQYAGDRQLATITHVLRAWQDGTGYRAPVRGVAGVDAVRAVAYADSENSWDAMFVDPPECRQAAPPVEEGFSVAPQPHPRLFVTADELARLRALAKLPPEQLAQRHPEFAQAYKQLIDKAEHSLTREEISVYGGRYKTTMPPAVPPRHDDDFPYWTGLSREIENCIQAMATAYLLTGDERYAEGCRAWTLALCEWPTWNDPDYSSHPSCLDTGHFCHAVAFAYDFLYDCLSPERRKIIADALLEKGAEAVYQTGEKGWARTQSWPNGFAVVMGGMGVAGMAVLGDDERAARYVEYARRRVGEFYDAQDRDGGYVEGLVYGGYAMSLTMPFVGTLAAHGDELLSRHPYIHRTLRFATYCLEPFTGTSVNFCDSTYTSRAYNSTAAWRARAGDGLARWYLDRALGTAALHTYTPPLSVLWHPLDTQPEAPSDWEPGAHYRDIGWAIMRSGFEGRPQDILFAMRSGYHGSHCQLDQNSFMLNLGGQWLLQDPGYGKVPTELHSTLLVDGLGQAAAGGEMVAFGRLGNIVYAAGDAARCYPGLKTFTRHVVMVDRAYIVVVDELAPAAGPVEVTSQLVTAAVEPLIGTSGAVRISAGEGDATRNCTAYLSGSGGQTAASTGDGAKTIRHTYRLAGPRMVPMVISPEGREPVGLSTLSGEGIIDIRINTGTGTDIITINTTAEMHSTAPTEGPVVRTPVESDARVTRLRVVEGAVVDLAAVWGSTVRYGDEVLLQSDDRLDYSM